MPVKTLEERVTDIEKELTQLKQRLEANKPQRAPHPWETIFGSFANSEGFDEAVRLGREYRESLRPKDYEEAA